MHPLAGARARAYLVDCGAYLCVAAATVPMGVVGHHVGWGRHRAYVLCVSAVPPLVATLLAARQESGPRGATLGKRHQGLVVRGRADAVVTSGRALIRNTVKIGVPWQLGHVVAIGAAFGGFERRDPVTLGAAAVTYPLLATMVVAAALGGGRALHDRVAGTVVERTETSW